MFLRTGYLVVYDRVFTTRMGFSIEKLAGGMASGSITVTLYNLSGESRNWLESVQVTANRDKGKPVQIFAGYAGNNKAIFEGQYFHAWTERRGPDLVTTLQLVCGLDFMQRVSVHFSGLNDDLQVYEAITEELGTYGLSTGFLSDTVRSKLQGSIYMRPKADSGSAARLMDDLVRRNGLLWNIDNRALNVYSPYEYEDTDAFYLSTETGMIGYPSKTQEQSYKVSSLLNPELVPGRKVIVKSIIFKQDTELKIVKLTHVGDTWEGEWRTEMLLAKPGAYNFLLMGAA